MTNAEKLKEQVQRAGWPNAAIVPMPDAAGHIEIDARDPTGDWRIIVDGSLQGQPQGYSLVGEPGTPHEHWHERIARSTVPTPEQAVGALEETMYRRRS